MSNPRLPPELERKVFLEALWNDTQHPENLFRVAKRIRDWLVPVAYRIVVVHKAHPLAQTPNAPVKFDSLSQFQTYGSHIKHLFIARMSAVILTNLDSCLTHCPNLTQLGIWFPSPPVQLDTLRKLSKLTHLTFDTDLLVHAFQTTLNQTPAFPGVTHWDIIGTHPFTDVEEKVTLWAHHFPALTHIAFLRDPTLLPFVTVKFKNIKAVISHKPGMDFAIDESRRTESDDSRVLMLLIPYTKGLAMWRYAEEVLKKRAEENKESTTGAS